MLKAGRVQAALPHLHLTTTRGRWGETDSEKDPVDLFPVKPTDEALPRASEIRTRRRMATGFKPHFHANEKEQMLMHLPSLFVRKMGLEPTQRCRHKILSLARLPIPTLPRFFYLSALISAATKCILLQIVLICQQFFKTFFSTF